MAVLIIGCSDSSSTTENETLSLDSQIETYIEQQKGEPLAVVDPSSNEEQTERKAVLFKGGLYEVSKKQDGSLATKAHTWEERSDKVAFNVAYPYLFTIIKDQEIAEEGASLEMVLENGTTFSSELRSDRTPKASIFYYGDLLTEDADVRASLSIYDGMGNEIYEKKLGE
ncbi:hypothetical protein H0266_15550 [Halobacillus locisalis]|uniref:Uncharacterized protein n=1 Tax=Halobacillus locisalis TaxID=220753 RepID=A0A838CWM2_9BACI|nr:hypothetical protein [Halobacillus locisalis]MBA2176311.1 hypothetical protein [Halobacillus locisalis]